MLYRKKQDHGITKVDLSICSAISDFYFGKHCLYIRIKPVLCLGGNLLCIWIHNFGSAVFGFCFHEDAVTILKPTWFSIHLYSILNTAFILLALCPNLTLIRYTCISDDLIQYGKSFEKKNVSWSLDYPSRRLEAYTCYLNYLYKGFDDHLTPTFPSWRIHNQLILKLISTIRHLWLIDF